MILSFTLTIIVGKEKVEQTIDFYRDLGFGFEKNNLLASNSEGKISLLEVENNLISTYKHLDHLIYLKVDDIKKYKSIFKDKTIIIDREDSTPIGEYLHIKDPNGNKICVYEQFI